MRCAHSQKLCREQHILGPLCKEADSSPIGNQTQTFIFLQIGPLRIYL